MLCCGVCFVIVEISSVSSDVVCDLERMSLDGLISDYWSAQEMKADDSEWSPCECILCVCDWQADAFDSLDL